MRKWLLIIIVALASFAGAMVKKNKELKADRDRIANNFEAISSEHTKYLFRDSLNVASISSLNLTVSELKALRSEDQKLIKDLRLRPKEIQYINKTTTITKDSLVYVIDSTGCFHHRDDWLTIDACTKDSLIVIANKDSIAQIIYPVYKRRFLWMKWGFTGVKQELINFNPHTKVSYAEMIILGK